MAPEQGHGGEDQSRQEGPGHCGVWAPKWMSVSGEAQLMEDWAEDTKV